MTTTGDAETIVAEYGADMYRPNFALFNEARTHRYLLVRRWGDGAVMTWIMLNPSTADAFNDDPTIRRCVRFARREGFGGIRVLNLFALRSPDPQVLRSHPDPVGASNDRFISEWAAAPAVAAWGAHGSLHDRNRDVMRLLAVFEVPLLCLGVTKVGHPKHPLARGRERIPDNAPLVPFGGG